MSQPRELHPRSWFGTFFFNVMSNYIPSFQNKSHKAATELLRLEWGDFVTKYSTEVKRLIDLDGLKLLEAEAGGGKSIAIILIMCQMIQEGKRPAFLVPTINLVNSLIKEINKTAFWRDNFGIDPNDFIIVGRGMKFGYEASESDKAIISTYDFIGYKSTDIDSYTHYVIDEGHETIGSSSYRAVCRSLYTKLTNVTLVTATPDEVADFPLSHHLHIKKPTPEDRKRNVTIRPLIFTEKQVDSSARIAVMKSVLDYELRMNPNRLYIVLHNNINENYTFIDELRERKFNAIPYNSIKDKDTTDRAQAVDNFIDKLGYSGKDLRDLYFNSQINDSVDVVLATSAAYAGVSLDVYKDVKFIYFSSRTDSAGHPAHMIQLINRVRESSGVNVEMDVWIPQLYGKQTNTIEINEDTKDHYIHWNALENWEAKEKMDVDSLRNYLDIDSLNVKVEEPEILITAHKAKHTSQRQTIDILKAAETNSDMHDYIRKVALAGFDTDFLRGGDSMYSKYTSVQSNLCKIVAELSDCGIDPNNFITEKSFSPKKASLYIIIFTSQDLATIHTLRKLSET
ncbi:DEAD/DEAH box helicase family protein, partial [Flavobacteriaceae bacterium]|nr:DEAD/DEAH box helicase family protein [Flavobacteriaceae bacterium]